jgi:hypothetical protein
MATHDYVIANQGFPAFRSDLNNALAAIVSNNSSATEPTTMFAHMIWVDTAADPSILKIRNADNDAWITIGSLNQTADTFTLTSAVSATTLNTSGQVVFNDAGADVDFRVEGDTDANLLFVDASADAVGIGTSSVAGKVQIDGVNTVFDTNCTGQVLVRSTTAYNATPRAGIVFGVKYNAGGSLTQGCSIQCFKENGTDGNFATGLLFSTQESAVAPAERARITSGGDLLVGATSALSQTGRATFVGAGNGLVTQVGNSGTAYQSTNTSGTSAYYAAIFSNNGNTFSTCGTIQVSGSTTSYNTSSDYRLKENVAPMTGALAKVLELNPVTYTWKADGSDGEGFIAHELQEVAPYAVSGEKDGEEMQGVDYGKITPLLTAALQEAIAEIQSLKARVAELEAK